MECGRYVGEVSQKENGSFQKTFQVDIGKILHNSAEMIANRNRSKNTRIASNISAIEAKKAEIARLQAEIASYQNSKEDEYSGLEDEER